MGNGWSGNTSNCAGIRDKYRYGNVRDKKKEKIIDYVNKDYIEKHSEMKISVEMDEMWSYCHDKKQEVWLWWAIDYETGEVIAFWFGTREHKSLDKLMELLAPLDIGMAYTDGNYAYFKHFSPEAHCVGKRNTQKIERKHLSLRTWCARLVRKGIRFSKSLQMHMIVVGLVINRRFFRRQIFLQ